MLSDEQIEEIRRRNAERRVHDTGDREYEVTSKYPRGKRDDDYDREHAEFYVSACDDVDTLILEIELKREHFPIFLVRRGSSADACIKRSGFVLKRNAIVMVDMEDDFRIIDYPTGEYAGYVKLKVVSDVDKCDATTSGEETK